MLIRYGTNDKGKRVKIATIYTPEEHTIDKSKLDKDALTIIRRLKYSGYDAYVVGGAVRDLLIGRTPKDFDIVTDARPRQIKKVFRNARIIGKRFRLVHIRFGEKIIEVSTFRGLSPGDEQNIFGSMEDDVKRRDFTFNGLYYTPFGEQLIDYVGGFEDVRHSRMVSLIPLDVTFKEDPVRLIRAVKYAATTEFSISLKMKKALKKFSSCLADVSISRLTEELLKILASGNSKQIFLYCIDFDLLKYIIPVIEQKMNESVLDSLDVLDKQLAKDNFVTRDYMIYSLTKTLIPQPSKKSIEEKTAFKESFMAIKKLIAPLTPPNAEVGNAVNLYFKDLGLPVKSFNTYNPKKRNNVKKTKSRNISYRKKKSSVEKK